MHNYGDAASHYIILMLFQHQKSCNKSGSFSKIENQCQLGKLVEILESQKLVPRTKSKGREKIPADFPIASCIPNMLQGRFTDEYLK